MHKSSGKNLFITLEFPPQIGGVGRMYYKLINEAPKKFTIWAPDNSMKIDQAEIINLPQLASHGWPRWRTMLANLNKILRRETFDSIIIGQILPIGLPIWLMSWFYNYRYTVIIHGLDLASPLEIFRKKLMIKLILRRAYKIIAANKNVAALAISSGVSSTKISVLYPKPTITSEVYPISRAEARAGLGLNNSIVVLTVARIVERKGHLVLFKAMASVWQKYPETVWVIIGDGPFMPELKKNSLSSKNANKIKILGELSDAETARWYAAADVFALTSHALPMGDIEGLGIVFLEAATFGLAIVASQTGAIPEFINNEKNGLLVKEKDSNETALALCRLIASPTLKNALGEQARKDVQRLINESSINKLVDQND